MTLAITFYLIICFLLIVFSLLQQGQSGGMGILGGSSSTFLGSAQASVLSRIVGFFAILFFVGAFFLNVISSDDSPLQLDLQPIETETSPSIENMPAVDNEGNVENSSPEPESSTSPNSDAAISGSDEAPASLQDGGEETPEEE